MASEDIRFYCGLSHKYWSFHPCEPGPFACISPIVGKGAREYRSNNVYVPSGTRVLLDSGAFADLFGSPRLSFADALRRQEQHAQQYDYADKIAYLASYDQLVDHRPQHVRGSRRIPFVSEADGRWCVAVSLAAAQFLSQHRNGYPLALNAQGVTPAQYLWCVQQIVPLLHDGDLLGLGGWCVLGRKPGLLIDFLQMLSMVIPFLAREQVPRVHIYGCIYTPALAALLAICDQYSIRVSTDSAFPSYGPRVSRWGYGSWRDDSYVSPEVYRTCRNNACTPQTRCTGLECIRHVRLTREWLSHFHTREYLLYMRYRRNLDQYSLGQVFDLEPDDLLYDEECSQVD